MSDPTRPENACDPVSIDAVAALIGREARLAAAELIERYVAKDRRRNLVLSECMMLAVELDRAGLLRTAEDRAVLDVFNEYAAAIRFTDDQGMTDPVRTSRASVDDMLAWLRYEEDYELSYATLSEQYIVGFIHWKGRKTATIEGEGDTFSAAVEAVVRAVAGLLNGDQP